MLLSNSQSMTEPTPQAKLKLVPIASAIAIGIIIALVIVLATSVDRNNSDIGGSDGVLGGDFVLQGINGDVGLADFRGKVVVLYFGFLSCPEVCPTSMGIIKNTLHKLSDVERQQIQPMLISIDPARDSVESLTEFSRYFDAQIIGLTGSQEKLQAIAADYGAYFKAVPSESDNSDYVFEHTSRYYVIDQQGKLIDAMRHSTTANELAARIRTLL